MPSKTFDTWLTYSSELATKNDVSGRYGGKHLLFGHLPNDDADFMSAVDFRSPEPSSAHQHALHLLREANDRRPEIVRVNGEQFDYVSVSFAACLGCGCRSALERPRF